MNICYDIILKKNVNLNLKKIVFKFFIYIIIQFLRGFIHFNKRIIGTCIIHKLINNDMPVLYKNCGACLIMDKLSLWA